MTCGVYKIKCSGYFYVGSSDNIEKRIATHLRSLRLGKHHNVFFQRVFSKHGEETLSYQVMPTRSLSAARRLEQKYLDRHIDNAKAMNIGKHATGGDNLTQHPDRARIVQEIKWTTQQIVSDMTDEERLERFSRPGKRNGMYGRTHTAEARAVMSAANKGHSRNKDQRRSTEAKANMSKAAKKRARSKGYVNPFAGKTHSKATRKILSQVATKRAAAGVLPSNTRRVKIGKTTYRSLTQAARAIGVVAATVLNRIRSDNFPGYKYID